MILKVDDVVWRWSDLHGISGEPARLRLHIGDIIDLNWDDETHFMLLWTEFANSVLHLLHQTSGNEYCWVHGRRCSYWSWHILLWQPPLPLLQRVRRCFVINHKPFLCTWSNESSRTKTNSRRIMAHKTYWRVLFWVQQISKSYSHILFRFRNRQLCRHVTTTHCDLSVDLSIYRMCHIHEINLNKLRQGSVIVIIRSNKNSYCLKTFTEMVRWFLSLDAVKRPWK